ncbi:Wzz/FepE/Etk N-terminal domain-containing protein, partial [Escherichia coli]
LFAILYALLATPIYETDALIQIEQKQGNAILSSLSQVLPDGQPQSAPETALLQSRMILGKTIDDLNLQIQIEQKYFPVIGRGLARLMGEKPGDIDITRLYLPDSDDISNNTPSIILTVKDKENYSINSDGIQLNGVVGTLLNEKGISLLVNEIDAKPGDQFVITQLPRLKAISDLLKSFSVADLGKDTGMLTLTLTGDNPKRISHILDSISQNYLAQNIARQAAQDAKSLEFLNQQLPKVRAELDSAEDKLNAYRKQK